MVDETHAGDVEEFSAPNRRYIGKLEAEVSSGKCPLLARLPSCFATGGCRRVFRGPLGAAAEDRVAGLERTPDQAGKVEDAVLKRKK
jgi:hypothetical protein